MKKIFVLVVLMILSVGCASQKANQEVNAEAANFNPVVNPRTQYARAISMVEFNPDLTQDQKDRLINLIDGYSQKMYENKQKESQYRTVLMDEMLSSDKEMNSKIAAAKKDITDLNQENSKSLEAFVKNFKSVIGKSAHHHQPELLEVILVE